MNSLKPELNTLLNSLDPDIAAMAKGYSKVIDDINEHVLAKTQLKTFAADVASPQGFGQYTRKALYKEPEVEVVQAAGGKLKVDRTQSLGTMRKSKDGRLEVVKEDATLNERHPGFANGGLQYTARLEDGSVIRYRPWRDKNGGEPNTYYAQRGELEVIVPGKPGAITGDRALEILEDLGVDVKPPTPDDLEFVYLSKVAYASTEHLNPQYQTMIAAIPANAPVTTKIATMRKYWETKLNIPDLTKHSAYQPAGQYSPGWQEWKNDGIRVDAGRRFWRRFDVDEKEFKKEMKLYHVHQYTETIHRSSDHATLAYLKRSLGENGSLLSTRERMRVGIKAGESPGSDMNKGGANYVYTRIKSRGTSGSGLAWKPDTLKRVDAVSYDYDAFGEMRSLHVETKRATGLKAEAGTRSWRAYAGKTDNETLFKYDMSLLEDIDAIIFDSLTSVDEAVEMFKSLGITHLPDGRAIEDIIMTYAKYKTI